MAAIHALLQRGAWIDQPNSDKVGRRGRAGGRAGGEVGVAHCSSGPCSALCSAGGPTCDASASQEAATEAETWGPQKTTRAANSEPGSRVFVTPLPPQDTPLNVAAAAGQTYAIRALLAAGANCTVRNHHGNTAMVGGRGEGIGAAAGAGYFNHFGTELIRV